MNTDDLQQVVLDLSPAEKLAVKQFITFLKDRGGSVPQSPFLAAVDEFIAAHPELLRRLSQ